MKQLTVLILLVATSLSFNACKKYEDGPMLSLRSAKSRVDGDWKVTSFTATGENLLNYVSNEQQTCSSGAIKTWTNSDVRTLDIIFDKSGTFIWKDTYNSSYGIFDYFNCTVDMQSTSGTDAYPGTWVFTDKKKQLQMTVDGEWLSLDITRLTNKEMELKGFMDGELIEMSLETND